MMEMNPQVSASIRQILTALGSAAVTMGIVSQGTMTSVIGVVMVIFPFVWDMWSHRTNGIIAAAAALPQVSKIITTPEIANSTTFSTDPTVVAR